jgi:hypothetical protein
LWAISDSMNGANWVSDMRVSLGLGCDGISYANTF